MKRNLILAVVAIAALAIAGMGGLFADFSDIEISEDNYFRTGSLDLTVSNAVGTEYNGANIPVFWEISDAWPGCDKSVFFDLENWGQGTQKQPWVYMHMKNFECGWVYPKLVYKWINCEDGDCLQVAEPDKPGGGVWSEGDYGTGLPKPVTEPEYVAECGGIAGEDEDGNKVIVPGVGCCYGETCQLPDAIIVHKIEVAGPWPHAAKPEQAAFVPSVAWSAVNMTPYDTNGDGVITLGELECQEVELAQLPNCNGIWVHISLVFFDIDEDTLIEEGLLQDPGTGYGWFDDTIRSEAKWDHWPTNAVQKDGVLFDIAFELLQNRYVPL